MTSRKIKLFIPLENDGIFTYDIWEKYINNIRTNPELFAEGVNYYEVSVILAEGWTTIYNEAFKNIQEGIDVDDEGHIIDNAVIFSLVNILLPSTITHIHANAFTYTTNLERLMFQRNNNITIHPKAFVGSGLMHILMHLETLETLNMLDKLALGFGKDNHFYGKDMVDINNINNYIKPKAGGARRLQNRRNKLLVQLCTDKSSQNGRFNCAKATLRKGVKTRKRGSHRRRYNNKSKSRRIMKRKQ